MVDVDVTGVAMISTSFIAERVILEGRRVGYNCVNDLPGTADERLYIVRYMI